MHAGLEKKKGISCNLSKREQDPQGTPAPNYRILLFNLTNQLNSQRCPHKKFNGNSEIKEPKFSFISSSVKGSNYSWRKPSSPFYFLLLVAISYPCFLQLWKQRIK